MIMNLKVKVLLVIGVLILLPKLVFAHSAGGQTSSLISGFVHPLSGVDHLIAMLGIGIWAGQLKGKATWVLPIVFTLTLVIGGLLGVNGLHVPATETMILFSLVVLGLVIALTYKASLGLGIILAMSFALFHGHAHGTEMTATFSGVSYFTGMVVSSIILQALGLCLALYFNKENRKPAYSFIGGSIMLSGLILFFV